VGVYMKNWSLKDSRGCSWELDQESARMAAGALGIPLYTWDFEQEYKHEIVEYMIREYREGRTPNPDVMCNKVIKFGLFFEKAMRLGADRIATGHYARIEVGAGGHRLLAAEDKNKDQSYFLWMLGQEVLGHTLFPIGDYTKPEVRNLARKFDLPNAERKDSQGLCFVGKVDFREFLKNFIPEKEGRIFSVEGNMLGTHPGIQFFTIGQRHGIGLGGGEPYFVVAKDAISNTLYLARGESHSALFSRSCKVSGIHWVLGRKPEEALARIRYRQPLQSCRVTEENTGTAVVEFDEPQRAVAPGQSIVFYAGDEVLGGGIIDSSESQIHPVSVRASISAKATA